MPEKLTPEQERLVRLRENQLASRDPHIKDRKLSRELAERERKRDNSLSLVKMWQVIPKLWRGVILSALVSVLAFIIVPEVWISNWALPCVGGGALILTAVSALIGNALDVRDNLRDFSRH
jgi:hypothetical protein